MKSERREEKRREGKRKKEKGKERKGKERKGKKEKEKQSLKEKERNVERRMKSVKTNIFHNVTLQIIANRKSNGRERKRNHTIFQFDVIFF